MKPEGRAKEPQGAHDSPGSTGSTGSSAGPVDDGPPSDDGGEAGGTGQWVAGRDGWGRAWARNAVRTVLVLFTVQLSVAVPHFALLSGWLPARLFISLFSYSDFTNIFEYE